MCPTRPYSEAALVVGRRGGKSRILALIVTYLATSRDHTSYLTPGEVADRNSRDTKVVRMTPAGACEVSDGRTIEIQLISPLPIMAAALSTKFFE